MGDALHIKKELPSPDESMSDSLRLSRRLKFYNMKERKVAGDGNCQFRALSDQLYQTTKKHEIIRKQVVDQIKSHPEIYAGYVPMPFEKYLTLMSRNGKWGDHLTLQAAADLYGVQIKIITSFKDTCWIEIQPAAQTPSRVVMLSFRAEVHYNSVYPDGELKELKKKKKNKWWHFCQKN